MGERYNDRLTLILIAVMALTTYLVRAVPFAAMRKKIENRFLRSVLCYMPYAILSAMTVPAVFYSTGSIAVSAAGFAVGMILSLMGRSLFTVSAACSAVSLGVWLLTKM